MARRSVNSREMTATLGRTAAQQRTYHGTRKASLDRSRQEIVYIFTWTSWFPSPYLIDFFDMSWKIRRGISDAQWHHPCDHKYDQAMTRKLSNDCASASKYGRCFPIRYTANERCEDELPWAERPRKDDRIRAYASQAYCRSLLASVSGLLG